MAAAPVTPDYSKEAFVIQEFTKDFAFAADGTWQCVQSASVRVQSDVGVRQFGVLSFAYDSDEQKIQIDYVRVRKADGTIVVTPPETVQDISSEVARVAPTYSDLREKQIPVKALSAGDTLEYKLRYTQTKAQIPGEFWYSQNFLSGGVVLHETLRISVPADKYVKIISHEVKPAISEEAGEKIYLWQTAQLKPTSQQDNKISAPAIPAVELTTFKSWDEVGRWYGQLAAARVVVTPAIQAKADELIKGLASADEKRRAIYDYVSTKFRYISLSFGMGRYQPHFAQEVFANEYGDCKDKHTVFAALLKAAGIEAWPALIGMGMKLDPDVPSLGQFNHVITVVPDAKGLIWLDTTPEVAPYGLLEKSLRDQKALVIPSGSPASLMTTPADPPFPSSETLTVDASLATDGTLKGHFDFTMRGDSELIFRSIFHQVPPSNWQEIVQKFVNMLGFAGTVSNVEIEDPSQLEKPFHYSYDYIRKDYPDWANHRITAPLYPVMVALGGSVQKPKEPIFISAPGRLVYRAVVHLPKGFAAEVPKDSSIEESFGVYHASYMAGNASLSVEREFDVKQSEIPLTDWGAYQKFNKRIVDEEYQYIPLSTPAKPQPASTDAQAQSLIDQAAADYRAGKLNAASDALDELERLNPKQRNLWWWRSMLYSAMNQPQKALDALQKEVDLHPDYVDAYRVLAKTQVYFRQPDKAIETLRAAVKVAPKDAQVASELTSLLLEGKRYPEALEAARIALQHIPGDPHIQLAFATALLRAGHKRRESQQLKS